MAIVINHDSTQRDNNDDFSPHNIDEKGYRNGHSSYGSNPNGGGVRGDYDERYNNDNVVDNHNRNDHNRKDHFIEEAQDGKGPCDNDRHNGRHCSKIEAPIVLAPVVAVTAGTTTIGAFDDRVVIQILNNVALIATYTLVLQPLQKCDTGYIVVETANGITSLIVVGASNVSSSVLTTAGSSIVLTWNGSVWVQV